MASGRKGVSRVSPRVALLFIVILAAAIAAGCGSSSGGSSTSTPAAAATTTSAPSTTSTAAAAPAGVPASLAKVYDGAEFVAKVNPNPYASWKAPAPPWKFCENESYTANPWRQLTIQEYKKLVSQYAAKGLAKGPLVITDSNNDATLQITQFNNLVSQGCNVIVTFPANPTALCPAITKARAKGVLVMTDHSSIDCPDVINVGFNAYNEMKLSAEGLFKGLGGKGTVVYVTGIKGAPTEITLEKAVAAAKKNYPDIKIAGQFEGKWTPSVAQTGMSQFLSTHPQKVDGIVDFGGMSVGVTNALKQAGRPFAKLNSPTAECAVIALWKQNPETATVGTSLDPTAGIYETFYVAAKMLKGAQPVVNTLLFPLPQVTPTNLGQWYKPGMTTSSTCYGQNAGIRAVPDSYFDALLKGGAAIEPITP
jgi:ribose transport system substrate-binding protein